MNGVFSIPLADAPPHRSAARGERAKNNLGEFIAGPENKLLAVAIKTIVENNSPHALPLILYGPSGCGKTHLARGLATWWEKHHPTARVVAITAAEFAQQYAEAVEHDCVQAWREKIRAADLLVLDDLSSIANKRAAQQELRSTLDALADRGSPIVVTSRVLPALLTDLSESLRSRLASGLAAPVNIPGPETRREILERFAASRGTALNKRAAQTLADALSAPAPALLGALMELELAAQAKGVPVDAAQIRRYLADSSREHKIAIRDIAVAAAKYFGLRLADLKSPSRRQAIVTARNVAMFLARQLTDRSLEQVGAYFGGRDHTTVLHGYQRVDKLGKTDPATRQAVTELKRLLTQAA